MRRFRGISIMLLLGLCACAPTVGGRNAKPDAVAVAKAEPAASAGATETELEPEKNADVTVAEAHEPPAAKEEPAVLDLPPGPLAADDAMRLLKAGNERYISGDAKRPHQGADRRAETAKNGQHPFATVLGCSDSRVPVETLFDQGVGDLFVVRTAGNVAGPDELASIEYGVGHLGTPVVLVLGHTGCGAVTAVVENAHAGGNLPAVLNQIRPAVAKAKAGRPTSGGGDILSKAIKANVWLVMENILRKSAEVRAAVKDGRALLVGGIYNLSTGKVEWLGQHPEQGRILVSASVVRKPKPKPRHKPKPKPKAEEKAGEAASKPAAEAAKNAKPAREPAKAAENPDAVNPGAHSEGDGSLLAPEPEAAPAAKPAAHARKKHK